ncbi:MAG: hypothetical protein GXO85_09250 [Chlorobi bacterium]|nr:hypothetical protein [Chlorobiota bacterium]
MKKLVVVLFGLLFIISACSTEKTNTMKLAANSGNAGFKDGNPADLNNHQIKVLELQK